MNLRELIDRYRLDTGDQVRPYLWSDEEITSYANEAEDETCRRAGLLVDSSSELTQLDVSAGDTTAELGEGVIYVRRVRLLSNGQGLVPRVSRAMDEEIPGWEDASPATPIVFVPDWESGKLRFWPPFAAADTLRLTVVRTPSRPMCADSDSPEIPRRYHAGLLNWMKHLGYQKQDADTFDAAKASRFEERFSAEFGPPSAAIDEHWAAEQYYGIGER